MKKFKANSSDPDLSPAVKTWQANTASFLSGDTYAPTFTEVTLASGPGPIRYGGYYQKTGSFVHFVAFAYVPSGSTIDASANAQATLPVKALRDSTGAVITYARTGVTMVTDGAGGTITNGYIQPNATQDFAQLTNGALTGATHYTISGTYLSND